MQIPSVPATQVRHSHVLQQPLAAPRAGIMLHYDDSSRDDWALAWFDDPRCTNGYTWLALEDGSLAELADPGMRTPHAGACLTKNPNSVYYGLSAATNGLRLATDAQLEAMIATCVAVFRFHAWPPDSTDHRIVGHDAQAVWTPAYTRAAGIPDARGTTLWGKLGRKVDPTGVRKDRHPIIDITAVRHAAPKPFCHSERPLSF